VLSLILSGSTMTTHSAPCRAIVSPSRTQDPRRSVTDFSNMSPVLCPRTVVDVLEIVDVDRYHRDLPPVTAGVAIA